MTVREMLELAAKAAGLDVNTGYSERYYPHDCRPGAENPSLLIWNLGKWNPLTNGNDALKLATALHMTVRCYMGTTCVQIGVPGQPTVYVQEADHADPDAATRLAITRAAAEFERGCAVQRGAWPGADGRRELTPEFPPETKPVHVGVYKTRAAYSSAGTTGYSHWDGESWGITQYSVTAAYHHRSTYGGQSKFWRGLKPTFR